MHGGATPACMRSRGVGAYAGLAVALAVDRGEEGRIGEVLVARTAGVEVQRSVWLGHHLPVHLIHARVHVDTRQQRRSRVARSQGAVACGLIAEGATQACGVGWLPELRVEMPLALMRWLCVAQDPTERRASWPYSSAWCPAQSQPLNKQLALSSLLHELLLAGGARRTRSRRPCIGATTTACGRRH